MHMCEGRTLVTSVKILEVSDQPELSTRITYKRQNHLHSLERCRGIVMIVKLLFIPRLCFYTYNITFPRYLHASFVSCFFFETTPLCLISAIFISCSNLLYISLLFAISRSKRACSPAST